MKTKKLFLMAAMLLMSVCTFAQNSTSLKGDVNEDGTVDVADLVSIMKIMKDAGGTAGDKMYYWYAGVNGGNAVTEGNFTDVASKIAMSQIPQTGFVTAADQYVYFVMPETRIISSLTNANNTAVDYDCTDAYGYHIYKTKTKYSGKLNYAIAERIYHWHIGMTTPAKTSWSESDFNQTSTKPITSFTVIDEGTDFNIWIVPIAWGNIVSMKVDGIEGNPFDTPTPWITNLPVGYAAYYGNLSGNTEITDIVWKK